MILEQVIFERAGGALALADGRATAELAIAGDVPTLLARLGVMKPLVVSGGGLARSGVAEEMARRGMPLVHFDGFAPNPTAEQVQAGLAMFRAEGCDGILSIGGGSAMDVAKGIKALDDGWLPADEGDLALLAGSVNAQRLGNYPVALTEDDLYEMYRRALWGWR